MQYEPDTTSLLTYNWWRYKFSAWVNLKIFYYKKRPYDFIHYNTVAYAINRRAEILQKQIEAEELKANTEEQTTDMRLIEEEEEDGMQESKKSSTIKKYK